MATSLVNTIQTYLQRKHSPLAPYAQTFVNVGNKYGVDPRFLVAISGIETGFATAGERLSNPFGYNSTKHYPSVTGLIDLIGRNLTSGSGYYAGKNTIPQIGATWAPVGASNDPNGTNGGWPGAVSQFYREMGGDPSKPVKGSQYRGAGMPVASTTTPGQTTPPTTGGATLPTASVSAKPFDFNAMMRLVNADMPRIMAGQTPQNIWKILALGQNQRAPVVTMTPGQQGTTTTGTPTATTTGAQTPAATGQVSPRGGYVVVSNVGKRFQLPVLGTQIPTVSTSGSIRTPSGDTMPLATFDGKKVSAWWAAILTFARQHGWKGGLNSGYRSVAEQQQIWNGSDHTGRTVARPGHSPHNYGMAVDLNDGPGFLAIARKYGLPVWQPMSYEDWHFEPRGSRPAQVT